jgi:hypothetical protein
LCLIFASHRRRNGRWARHFVETDSPDPPGAAGVSLDKRFTFSYACVVKQRLDWHYHHLETASPSQIGV